MPHPWLIPFAPLVRLPNKNHREGTKAAKKTKAVDRFWLPAKPRRDAAGEKQAALRYNSSSAAKDAAMLDNEDRIHIDPKILVGKEKPCP